ASPRRAPASAGLPPPTLQPHSYAISIPFPISLLQHFGISSLAAQQAAFVAPAERAQAFVGVDTGAMAVTPDRRQPVAPDRHKLVERRLLVSKDGIRVYAALHAALARAPRARAGSPERLVGMPALVAIRPGDIERARVFVHQVRDGRQVVG